MRDHLSDIGISAEQAAAVRLPLEQASLLPAHIYTDPAIFELERDRIFSRSWLPVCHVSQLGAAGDFVTRKLAGESIIALRGRDDEIRVLSNVCRHRYTALAQDSGNCKGNRLVCPYHGWAYGLDGKLLAAPFMDKVEGFDKADNGLRQFRHELWHGFLFINFDDDAAPLTSALGHLESDVAPYRFEDMCAIELYRQTVPWNWKISLENFSEAYHQPWVHPQTAEHFFPARKASYYPSDGPYSLFRLPQDDGGEIESLVPTPPHLGETERRAVMVYNVYPYFHSLVDPGVAITMDCNFTSATEHEQVWTMLIHKDQADGLAGKRDEFLKFIGPILGEDIGICRAVSQGAQSRHARPGRLSDMERAIHDFHNWWLDRMTS